MWGMRWDRVKYKPGSLSLSSRKNNDIMDGNKKVNACTGNHSHRRLTRVMHKGTHTGGWCSLTERWPSFLPGGRENHP